MRWADLQLRSSELSTTADEFIRWWFRELRAFVPSRLWDWVGRDEATLLLDVFVDRVVVGSNANGRYRSLASIAAADLAAKPTELPERLRRLPKGRVVIRLPAERIFRKTIELPLAAAGRLRSILSHEIERQTPLDADQVFFDYRILDRSAARELLKVELAIVRKEVADHAVATARALGSTASWFGVVGQDPDSPLYRFYAAGPKSSPHGVEATWTRALSIAALILAFGFLASIWWQQYRKSAYVQDQVALLRPQAEAVARLRQRVGALQTRLAFLPQQKRKPLLVEVLSEITTILPDGTWLAELSLEGSEVKLQGYAPAAAGLIELFDKSPLFANARFTAPVTQGPRSSLERFDLSVDIVEPKQ